MYIALPGYFTVSHWSRFFSGRKSATGTVLLNILLPGAGYCYCGRWLTGLLALALTLLLVSLFGEIAYAVVLPLLALDGYRVADAVNARWDTHR